MKRFLLSIFICCAFIAKGQVYNNEWIDFSKTYYKFKVGKTGLYRISQSALATIGFGSTPAQDFQLWRNGVQVPIYTSAASGSLSASDYIEFWGEMNDGKPDKELYRKPEYQLNDKWSLETDTAMYFLTVNAGGSNFRLTNTSNNVATNTLTAEPYFMHTVGNYFRERFNEGYAVNVDAENLFSSAYDGGEGLSSNEFSNATHTFSFNDLHVNTSGPQPSFNISLSGNSVTQRRFIVKINTDSVTGGNLDFFNYVNNAVNFSTTSLSSNVATISVQSIGDRMVIHKYEMTYPRNFNFGSATNFKFQIPANAGGNYLEISNFSFGSSTPVLYDLTNGQRYIADLTASPILKFVLSPSSVDRKLVLVSEESTNFESVTVFQQRNFNNYLNASNQGSYLIITNSLLFNGPNGSNPVEDYRSYRASAQGGGFSAKIYLEDELIDQFGFGIRKNPAGIRNFIRFTKHKFTSVPQHVFIIGKGVEYWIQRLYDSDPTVNALNLIPTMGTPASDNLLAAEPGSAIPDIPIGRISVIYPKEVSDYLDKMKENEQAQATLSPNIEDRGWMKNVIHLDGADGPPLTEIIPNALNQFKAIIVDSLYGANVLTFTKKSPSAVEKVGSDFKSAFEKGASLITYFGHSSPNTLSYALDEPSSYSNQGKYPTFVALGCRAGSVFGAGANRFTKLEGIAEKYVLTPKAGMITFLASTHFGIVHYLRMWNQSFYTNLSSKSYGRSIGEAIKQTAIDVFGMVSQEDHYLRSNVEELLLHGDPATKVNPHAKADYVITEPLVKIDPEFIAVNDKSFKLNFQVYNIGKAENKNIVIEVKRELPDKSTIIVYRDTIAGIRYQRTFSLNLEIDPTKEVGNNKLTVTVDADNAVDEFYETNNIVTKQFVIYEDDARPLFPYNFGIVNASSKLYFSTANPFSESKQYNFEIDTTELFNSSMKISKTFNTKGGVDSIDAGLNFVNNTVYYWRIAKAVDSGEPKWNTFSFIYLQNHDPGFNQSHLFQHFKSATTKMYLDSVQRQWKFSPTTPTHVVANIGTFFRSFESQMSVGIDGNSADIRSACWYSSIMFNVFDPTTSKPLQNFTLTPGTSWPNVGEGLFGSSANNCGASRRFNFEFQYGDTANRRKMMGFMRDHIPDGSYVLVRSFAIEDWWGRPVSYASDWMNDTLYHGSDQSLYHYLKNAGFAEMDSFNRLRQWAFVYKKNDPSFTPQWVFTDTYNDFAVLSFDMNKTDTTGTVTSPIFGPAKKWKQLLWDGTSLENPTGDNPLIEIVGVKSDETEAILFQNISLTQKSIDISSIDAQVYKSLKIRLRNYDSTKYTPFQLGYWRLTSDPVPEGAVAPNIYFKMLDTVDAGEPINFKLAFKNITTTPFDSLKVKLVITDKDNIQHQFEIKYRPLPGSDTLHVSYNIDTKNFIGLNKLYVEVNPDNDQPEQYLFNNFIYSKFYVVQDSLNPLLDVTFDNVHILNNDIVSSKPDIEIRLKDESKWMLLQDTSLISIKVRYPNGSMKPFYFNTDTLRFIGAESGSKNEATINFKPNFLQDGNYELIVSGKDESGNAAGVFEYKVAFQVINKAMISNMLNYPNPFTTSTAFVFTLTGSEVPQNLKIEILTVTGRIVREITSQELGPIHIGRNITEFKWDGTDQYGQKLGNGVYLYRVVTNLNGKSLEKYSTEKNNTDQYFNKGYGKMYLMR
jgi:hypothetical protein